MTRQRFQPVKWIAVSRGDAGCGVTAGFSLVEIALAMLITSIGLLTVVGLMTSGMTQSRASSNDSQAAMFAQQVFDSFRARLYANPSDWSTLDSIEPEPVTADEIYNTTDNDLYMYADGNVAENVFEKHVIGSDQVGVVDYAVRYRLTITEPVVGRVKGARLEVWNGLYGPTLAADASVFYTEFYNFGM